MALIFHPNNPIEMSVKRIFRSVCPKTKYNGVSLLIPSFLFAALGDLCAPYRFETTTSSINFHLLAGGDCALFIVASLETGLVPNT